MAQDLDPLTELNIYENFPLVLQERCSKARRKCNDGLKQYSDVLLTWVSLTNNSDYLKKLIHKDINYILTDCEIFFDMSESKAMDAMLELSNFAALYIYEPEYDHIYLRICNLITSIRASY